MKKSTWRITGMLAVVILLSQFSYGQNFKKDIVVKTFVFSLEASKKETGEIITKIKKVAEDTKQEFTLTSLELDPFRLLYNKAINNLESSITQVEAGETADKIFYDITVAILQQDIDQAPDSGTITIGESIPLFLIPDNNDDKNEVVQYLKYIQARTVRGHGIVGNPLKLSDTVIVNEKYQVGELKIKDVSIEFYEGYIENLTVKGVINIIENKRAPQILKVYHERSESFNNKLTIGFQTKNNYRVLKQTRLFESNDDDITIGFFVSEAMQYEPSKALLRKDYSPANGVVNLSGGETRVLKKSPLTKTFQILVFSDFLGVEGGNPNGLVQTEMSYRFNFNNRRYQGPRNLSWIYEGFGFFQYLRLGGSITKIEENGRFLIPKTENTIIGETPNQTIERELSTDPIDLLRHQTWNVGVDMNFLYAEDSDLKYHFYMDAGFRYGRTQVRDSLVDLGENGTIEKNGRVNDFGIGYNTYFGQAHIDFLPSENFGFSMTYRKSYVTPAFNELELETFDRFGNQNKPFTRWYNTFVLQGRTKLGESGNLFGRYRFNYQSGNVENNFHQFQVGYSFYLFSKTKTKKDNNSVP